MHEIRNVLYFLMLIHRFVSALIYTPKLTYKYKYSFAIHENIVSISRKEVTFKNILLYSAHALNFVHYLNILFYHCVCASGPKRGHYFAPHPIA